jgi:TM2 domain-containing membrane protein YozV
VKKVANPILAVVISFFFPGLGSVYAGKTMMGIIIFIIAIILAVLYSMVNFYIIILYIIVWLYGMYDAYTTAKATEVEA